MVNEPVISICIPAFQRVSYLKRLLDSIEIQSFRDFEVVLTDDSSNNEVFELAEKHALNPKIRYFKNPKKLGTPENWNEAMRHAKTDWIKIMHDDDWFAGPDSLRIFAEAITNGKAPFYFSSYTNVYPDHRTVKMTISAIQLNKLKDLPEILMVVNRIGPPSTTVFKKDISIAFDQRMQWLVDIDFYIRYLKRWPPVEFIPFYLIEIGISSSQVTQRSFGRPDIEIPERFMLNEKLGSHPINHIPIFDSWWRFLRNLSIREISQIRNAGYEGRIPSFIVPMIAAQRKIPRILLNQGVFSKLFMFLHYLGANHKNGDHQTS
jgi:glycosyltransferase involved in cell wall biosynthesis